MSAPFTIEVPADGAHATTIRVFVAGSGRALGFDDPVVEDLRLVATEFLANALERGGDGRLGLAVDRDGDAWTLRATGAGAFDDEPAAGLPMARIDILRAIATVEVADGLVTARGNASGLDPRPIS
jgi:anti-sigma regulatory factor (Ser/Thr protein kinase)